MASESSDSMPQRKEPGFIGRLFSGMLNIVFWLCLSLLISIMIEWIGITFFWSEQGANHAKNMLKNEQRFLNQRLVGQTNHTIQTIVDTTQAINQWVADTSAKTSRQFTHIRRNAYFKSVNKYYQYSKKYIEVIPYVSQVFFTRITIILFSLPAFILAGILGATDGLIERDLRRWGGGRESSNLYNIARKSIFPVFIMACMIYLSLPTSIHPSWVIMPFVVVFGFAVRVSFERLKKYF
jgi:integrating conjugative element membrane protein (TIGR03747 family)